jgi:predicted RecB family nuclease
MVSFVHMKNFTVIFMAPAAVLAEWMQKPEAERKEVEAKMKIDWDAWMAAHADTILNTIALGKTKRVSATGIEDVRNDMMISAYAQGESAEAVAEMFKGHPHFGIPGATIEIMEVRPM